MRSFVLRYAVAFGVSAGTAWATLQASPTFPETRQTLLLAAVAFASWFGGLGPGLLSAAVAGAGLVAALRPFTLWGIEDPQAGFRIALFGLVALLISALNEKLRSAKQQADYLTRLTEDSLHRERAAQRRYGDLVQGLDAVVWEADAETLQFTFVSEQVERLLGYPVVRLLTERTFWTDSIHPEDRERTVTALRAAGAGVEQEIEYRVLAEGGRTAWLRDRIRVVTDDENAASGPRTRLRGLMVDITDRRRAEETLRRSEEWYRRVVDTCYEGIWLIDGSERVGYVNWRIAEMLGYSAEEIVGRSALDFLFASDRELHRERLEELRGGKQVQFDARLRRKDGSELWTVVSASPILSVSGDFTGLLAMITDVTERKRAEDALRFLAEGSSLLAASLDYQTTLDQIAQLCVPRLADWCFVDVAEPDGAFRRLAVACSSPEHGALADSLRRLYRPRPDAAHGVSRVLRTREPEIVSHVTEEVLEGLAADAGHLAMMRALGVRSFICAPLVAHGRTIGTIALITAGSGRTLTQEHLPLAQDLAGRAAVALDNAGLYREMQRTDRAKTDFLAMLAHELRNPLGAISNALEVVRVAGTDDVAGRRAMDVMERQIRHQGRLVGDLLDVSRITQGKIELRKEPMDLARLVRDAGEDHRSLLRHSELTLAVEIADEPIYVLGDAARLTQVIGNLLQNAAKFTDHGGQILLRVGRRMDGGAVVSVRDTGIGIEPEVLPHVFEPFTQADRSLDRTRGGLGLGLSLVKGLVELHGGEVQAQSGGIGYGAEFIVRLPALAADALGPEQLPVSLPGLPELDCPSITRMRRVLVIEDNRDAAETMRDLLELCGHEVRTAHSGTAGLATAERFHPHVVVCDIGLPGMDGYEVAECLRRDPDMALCRLIAVTGYGQENDRRRCVDAGFDFHLTKPVDPEMLRELISSFDPAHAPASPA